MAEVVLYGSWTSVFSKRVEMGLKLKGVEYEYIEEDFSKPSPWLLAYNPVLKTVPVLLHDGDPIIDSVAILEYIDETWNAHPPILPRDPKAKAMARFWTKFIDQKCIPSVMAACWSRDMMQHMAMADASASLKTLEEELKDRKFFGGDIPGIVDIAAGFIALWLGVMEEVNGSQLFNPAKFPTLCRWAKDFVNCSLIKDVLPPRDKLVSFYKSNRSLFQPGPPKPGATLPPFPPL